MSKEDKYAEAARAFGKAANECANAIGFGNWTPGWACEEASGSLSPVFGVDPGTSDDCVVAFYFPGNRPLQESPNIDTANLHITLAGGHCGDADCTRCDPMDRLVDGLSVRECLERFTDWQRKRDRQPGGTTIYWVDGVRMVRPWNMTHEQVAAARLAWSAELRRKQREAEAKERLSVCVDDDRWEP